MGEEMMKVHFVLHETFEVPGAYLKWAQERGHQVTTTKVYENEALPETVDDIDFLIVMGDLNRQMKIGKLFHTTILRQRSS